MLADAQHARDGNVVRRYPPTVAPASIAADIEKLL